MHKKQQWSVFKNTLLCRTTSFRHAFTSQFDSLKLVYYVEYYERAWYRRHSIHSSAQSHIHNKTLVWMSAEENNIFVVLSIFYLK